MNFASEMAARPTAAAPMLRPAGRSAQVALLAIFLLSGAAGLVYQVAWTRKLTLILGVTSDAVSTVLAVFMGGLALGSWWLGRYADRVASPLRLYALLEFGIAAAGVTSPFVLDALRDLYVFVHAADSVPAALLPVLRVTLAGAGLLVPTVLMGGTLPILVKGCFESADRLAREAGLLYGVNTLGALAGTLLSAFFLIQRVGIDGAIWVAAGTNLAVGVLAFALSRTAGQAASAAPRSSPRSAAPAADPRTARLVIVVFGVSGLLALAYEVVWFRYLVVVIGENSVYAFALMLAAFLFGIVAGSALAGWFGDRVDDLVTLLGAVIALVGATALFTPAWMELVLALPLPADLGFWSVSGLRLLRCIAVLVIPTTLSGSTFALVTKLYAREPDRLGADAGRAYAANTCGGILGALAGGFLVLPWLGLTHGLVALAAVNVAAGLALLLLRRPGERAVRVALGCLLVAGLGLLATLSTGNIGLRLLRAQGYDVRYFAEAPEYNVAVIEDSWSGARALVVDSDAQASTDRGDQIHLRLLGHLPAVFHPAPATGLVVGFGAGMSTGSLASHAREHVDVAELSRAVIRGATWFAPFNGDPLANPRVRVRFADGRHHLLTTRERYDVITSDPIDPDDAGLTNLYAREYFELVRDRLRDGGVMSQWMADRYDAESFRMLTRTFLSVFPQASLWRTGYSTVLLGIKGDVAVGLDNVRQRLAQPEVRENLEKIGVDGAESLLSLYLGGPEELRRFAGDGPINTDDHPRIEYSGPRWLSAAERPLSAELAEPFLAMRGSDLGGWMPELSAGERAALAPYTVQMTRVLERNLRHGLVLEEDERAALEAMAGRPAQPPPWQEVSRAARAYLDITFDVLRRDLPDLYALELGFDPEPALEARKGPSDVRCPRPEPPAREPHAVREGLRRADCADQRGDVAGALDAILATQPSNRIEAMQLRRMADALVIDAIARMGTVPPADAAALGAALSSVFMSDTGPPRNERLGDAQAWRAWWSAWRGRLRRIPGG